MFDPQLLSRKKILITGGGTGLGFAMAETLSGLGAELVLCGRRLDVLQNAAERLRGKDRPPAEAIACDVRNPDRVEALFDEIWAKGPLDGLVNNAGALLIGQTEHLSNRAVDAVLATTLHGAIYCTLAAGRRWISGGRRGGVVLSILSTSTVTGRAFQLPTAISKAGLLSMTRSLAVEWASRGIRLVAIAPGRIETAGFLERIGEQDPSRAGSDNSLERMGRPEEVANLAAFLLSDQASYVNGEMVVLDGGRHLRNSGVEELLIRDDEEWARLRAQRH